METVINYYFRELKLKQKIKDCILDTILIPPGWINIGYTGQLQSTRRRRRDLFGELVSPMDQPLDKTEAELGILDETIKNDDVFARYISANNIVWPDGYNNIREAPYIIEIQELPLIDVIANPLFNKSKFNLSPVITMSQRKKVQKFTMKANVPGFL